MDETLVSPTSSLLSILFSSPLFSFLFLEYEQLWMAPKGLGGDIKGHHGHCSGVAL